MRLTHAALCQLTPLVPTGDLCFEYHGTPRRGRLETLGEGPAGAFLLIRHPDGSCKSYSLAKMTGLREAEAENGSPAAPASPSPSPSGGARRAA
ncbi:hypothetical protein [Alienimonas chondri]|uniref:Uncharacterized protein n=1 Tax=Alienimonas chondri TaxID=2681879 RepID=A0ABX1VF82_9PLAN|nr:hypothetical protein [Alienimonas chondri]NNJ26651.1 hypothetical protein [Alienimonas chondri]